MPPVTIIIIGAGSRGAGYAHYATAYPHELRVVGVAEPREPYREAFARTHSISAECIAEDWRELVARERFADAVLIATPDRQHTEPAIAFARLGYAVLLEKPMAPSPADCEAIVAAVQANKVLFSVCHVMRYAPYTNLLKTLVDNGAIGDIVSIQHLEPVAYWHQAHSFVRGNWRNEAESSFMLLQKSCHDLDWLRYIIGAPCVQVSSFGGLSHFRRAAKPAAAGKALRCLDCAYEPQCPYSAKKIYLASADQGIKWPADVLTTDHTVAGITAALREGPYGRCVYECDNDVVDHQVVNLQYANGVTVAFTMTAFTETIDRQTRIFGTRGQLTGDGEQVSIFDFLSDTTTVYPVEPREFVLGGHNGGDEEVVRSFVAAVAHNDQSYIRSGADETLETHLTVFAAEQSRREGRIITL